MMTHALTIKFIKFIQNSEGETSRILSFFAFAYLRQDNLSIHIHGIFCVFLSQKANGIRLVFFRCWTMMDEGWSDKRKLIRRGKIDGFLYLLAFWSWVGALRVNDMINLKDLWDLVERDTKIPGIFKFWNLSFRKNLKNAEWQKIR